MSPSIWHLILAILGLSFLVFIHELGHFIAARLVGIRVEVFSIGIGKPLYVWHWKGVKWQIAILPFGGYIKMLGEEGDKGLSATPSKDDFYSKNPWQRIFVAIMGPVVNIVFALIAFTAIWFMGGRMKPFEEHTHVIGWVDPASELSAKGVRPGDTISVYNGHKFTGFQDLLLNGVLRENQIEIAGDSVNYYQDTVAPYQYTLSLYQMTGMPKDVRTIGVLAPASIMIFQEFDKLDGMHSPIYESGIQKGDRIIWANGELVFSSVQLGQIVNQGSSYLTIVRSGEVMHVRSPRTLVGDLQIDKKMQDELIDWRRELDIAAPIESLYFLTYHINEDCVVKGPISFIDNDLFEEQKKEQYLVKGLDEVLVPGDKIIAVNGVQVYSGIDIFKQMMERQVLLMVQGEKGAPLSMNWENQDKIFQNSVNWADVALVADQIGQDSSLTESGRIRLLKPITPMTLDEFKSRSVNMARGAKERVLQALPGIETKEYIFVGASLKGQKVHYNPTPIVVFNHLTKETWRTFYSLITGSLSPKWLSGPVGIVRVIHDGFSVGIKEAIYWLGLISLNLGLLNIVPIPVLDGGRICIFLYEAITRRRVSSKAMEQLMIPFVILLIMLFVYITYQDLSRLLG